MPFSRQLWPWCEIQQHRHGSIDGVGEAGLGGLRVFKFLPECQVGCALCGGQKAEDAGDGSELGGFALLPATLNKDHGVTGVDFADVVDQKHGDEWGTLMGDSAYEASEAAMRAICQLCSAEFS